MSKSLGVAILIAISVRCYLAYSLGLAEDEAYYWTWAQRLDVGYFDHPPMIAWWIALGDILGHSELLVRLMGLCSYPVMLWLCWDLSERSPLSIWVLLSFPLFLGSFLATPDMPLLLFWTLALWGMHKKRFIWLTIGIAGACLSKLTGWLLFPVLLLSTPELLTQQKWWKTVGGALLAISPFLWWNNQHEWISIVFQWQHVQTAANHLSFLLSQWGLIGVFLFPLVWYNCIQGPRRYPLAYWATVPLLIIGLISGGEANWIAPAYIGMALLLGRMTGKIQKLIWIGISFNLFCQILIVLHAIQPLRVLPKDPLHRLSGGQTLGESIAAWNEEEIWCTRYQEASLIWFYSEQPTHTIPQQGRKSQYDIWRTELPDKGLFIRPLRFSDHREIEMLDRQTADVFIITAFSPHERYTQPIHQWQVFPFSQ